MHQFDLLVFIDDDEATNYYNRYITRQSNISKENLFFQKAEDALNYFNSLSEGCTVPDAIFLDVNMPKMDGWEFLEQYSSVNLRKTPVIVMLTTSLSTSDRIKAEENELIHKLLNKPLTNEHLNELMNEYLNHFGRGGMSGDDDQS